MAGRSRLPIALAARQGNVPGIFFVAFWFKFGMT
jgi:hypothetical protein